MLSSLEALRAEAEGLTVHAEQLDDMTARVEKAQAWAARAKEALQGKAALKQVRTRRALSAETPSPCQRAKS